MFFDNIDRNFEKMQHKEEIEINSIYPITFLSIFYHLYQQYVQTDCSSQIASCLLEQYLNFKNISELTFLTLKLTKKIKSE